MIDIRDVSSNETVSTIALDVPQVQRIGTYREIIDIGYLDIPILRKKIENQVAPYKPKTTCNEDSHLT
jgi:hypothetical protein